MDRKKTLATLLGGLCLTAGAYYGVGHGTLMFYQQELQKTYAPERLAEVCTTLDKLPDGRLMQESKSFARQYSAPPKTVGRYELPYEVQPNE